MTYDIHAHVVPESLVRRLDASGSRAGAAGRMESGRLLVAVGERPEVRVRPDLLDVDARLTAMDAAGVDVQLLSAWIALTAYELPDAQGIAWSRLFNEALAETVDSHPDRFRGLATVPMQAGEAAAAELTYAVRELGMVGVQIATTVDGRELDDESWPSSGRPRSGCDASS